MIKVSYPSTQATHAMQNPSVCIVAQGAKSVMIGEDVYSRWPSSVDIPVAAQITRATPAEPYLTLKIDLDSQKITDLAKRAFPNGLPQARDSRPLYIVEADPHMIDAATRLIALMERPANAELIAPLVIDEILIRLLVGPMGPRIAQMGVTDSNFHRVAKAVSWLRENLNQPADVEALAPARSHESLRVSPAFPRDGVDESSQFQKALRL